MLTADQLNAIPLNPNALGYIPESIAVSCPMLPVSVTREALHVIVPKPVTHEVHKMLAICRAFLSMDVTCDYAEESILSPVVAWHYAALNSTIQNCDRKFEVRCPREWVSLTPTSDLSKRWCSECERHVTYCTSDEELDQLARAGQCVAFHHEDEDLVGMPML